MSDEILSTTEATIGESLEPTAPPLETAAPVVVDDPVSDETTVPVIEATEIPDVQPMETQLEETTENIVLVDYTPAFAESTSIVTNVILCGALMIVGVLCGIRFWR